MADLNRNLHFPNLLNVRDLGGCPTRSGGQTRWHSLVRSDDLCRLDAEGVRALLDYGVRTVIDLRWPVDAETHPNFLHSQPGFVPHHHLSLLGESVEVWRDLPPPRPKELFNCLVLEHFPQEVKAVLQHIAAAPPGGVLFHCVSGKDRTGVIAALLQTLVDVEPAVIIEDYGRSTENLRDAYLAAYPDRRADVLERVRCPPEQIENMWTYLHNHHQGIMGYLRSIGLQDDEIQQLKARLI